MRDHWLDGECVSRLHDADGLVLGVVGDVGRAVEEAVDAVPAVRPHHREALRLSVLLDHVAHLAVLNNDRGEVISLLYSYRELIQGDPSP